MSFFVVKRSGKKESVHFDKITSRVSKLCYGLNNKVGTIVLLSVVLSLINDKHIFNIFSSYKCIVCRSSNNIPKSNPRSIPRSNNRRTRQPSSRNSSIPCNTTPRLLYPSSPYQCIQLTQTNQEALLRSSIRFLPLHTPQDRRTSPFTQ